VQPGLRDHVYFLSKRDVVKWPKRVSVTDSGATMEKLATLQGEFVLKADKKWKRIDVIDSKAQMESDMTGEDPSKLYENKLTFLYPGVEEAATGFCQLAAEDKFIFLCVQRNGKARLVGSEMFSTEVKPKLSTGEGYSGGGTTIEVIARDISPAPFYTGKIEVDEGSISGATDEPTAAAAVGSHA
jgi:hypothetical protein